MDRSQAPRSLRGLSVLAAFTAALQSTMLAALLTFSRSPWYPGYESTVQAWGLTQFEGRQLAGVIMWVPGGLLHLGAGLLLFASWIGMTVRPESSGVVTAPGDG